MEHKVYYSMEFRRDLNEIWDYIASEPQSSSDAERVVTDILDAVQQLEDFAELGSSVIFYRRRGKRLSVPRYGELSHVLSDRKWRDLY